MLAATGLRLYDRSGRGNHGTLTNMDAASDWVTASVRGRSGRVLDFDGTNDFVALQKTVFELPFSVSIWFMSRSVTTVQTLFGLGSSASANPLFQVALRGDLAGDPVAATMRGSNVNINTFARCDGYLVNTWHHVVAVFSRTSLRQIWLDGVEGTADTTTYDVQTLNLSTIGALRRTTTSQYLNGQIAECVQWSRAIGGAEVRSLYNLGPGWFGQRQLRRRYAITQAAGFNAYWARRQSQLIGGGV
jgi:hypothetical protein